MTIGEKIKQIRKEKSLSQENVYPSNQSLVSQIEKGVNKNPTEQTLRIMADNMDMSFDELIEGTEWEIPRNVTKKSEYAFSQTGCVVHIEDSGEIKIRMKSYPLVETSGEENKFDPDTGYKLLTECNSCKRVIQQPNQKHCFGCGEKLFNNYSWYETMHKSYNFIDLDTGDEVYPSPNEQGHLDMLGYDSVTRYATDYTFNIRSNKQVANNLTFILQELNEIDKVVNPAVPYIASHKIREGTDAILMKVVGEQYYSYFGRFYFSMTIDEVNNSTTVGGATEDNTTDGRMDFHPVAGAETHVPIGDLDENHTEMDSTDSYAGGYMLYDLVDINPNKCKSDIIAGWWVLFKRDLSMTKGLLNEVLRHQKRLLSEADEEVKVLQTLAKPEKPESNEEEKNSEKN